MVIHATRMPASADARYHANRRKSLLSRLSPACESCGRIPTPSLPLGFMQVNHVHGHGGAQRAALGNAGEITRLLKLTDAELHAEVNALCVDCHKQDAHTHLFTSTKAAA